MTNRYQSPQPGDICEDCEHTRKGHDQDADFIDGRYVPLSPCLVDGCKCRSFQ